ncbi:hypothetical protein [Actinomadura kijaniata]|uniref:hypothetical protein n=1 Tax=Actinomadura kijaniata TaxID=46161 RepID=UPI00082FCDAE|nr:hypothetical protein [Actinomadura kijaniata]
MPVPSLSRVVVPALAATAAVSLAAPATASAAVAPAEARATAQVTAEPRVQAAAKPPKRKITFTNKYYDTFFQLGPCHAEAYHRNIGGVVGPGWTYMATHTRLYRGSKNDCRVSVKLRFRAMKDRKLHTLTRWKRKGTAGVDVSGKRCWSEHTLHYKKYSYTVKLVRDGGTRC